MDIAENRQWLETGRPKMEIAGVAEENDVDLIIVGSHGRHGLALLLGSTAKGDEKNNHPILLVFLSVFDRATTVT